MRTAIITDLHFGIKQNSDVFLKSQMDYLLNEFIPSMKAESVTDVIIAGDTFDSETSINIKTGNMAQRFFTELHTGGFNVKVLIGNHDIYLKSSLEFHSLMFFKKYENVQIIDTPTVFNNMLLVPWLIEPDKFIDELNKDICAGHFDYSCDICVGHFDMVGLPMYTNTDSTIGLSPHLFFSKFQITISGHYHIRSVTHGTNDNKIIYVGSPYQLTRNDAGCDRGYMILDTETLGYKFIDGKNTIKFVSVKYPDALIENKIHNNIVDVFVDYNNKFDGTKLEEYLRAIQGYGPAYPPQVRIITDTESKQIDKVTFSSTKDIISEYIDNKYTENQTELKTLMFDLYREVEEVDA